MRIILVRKPSRSNITALAIGAFAFTVVLTISVSSAEELGNKAVTSISDPAYRELTQRVTANAANFFVYQDEDSGFNHGFPSGFFGTPGIVSIDTGCVDDPADMMTGCFPLTDMTHLDRTHGTVLRVSFGAQTGSRYAGLNIEEPQDWGQYMDGVGYDLRPAAQVMFDVRSPTGISLQFGVGGCETNFIFIPQSLTYRPMTIPLNSLLNGGHCPPDLSDVHILFTIVTNAANAPNGGTVLLDNIRFTPVPNRQTTDPKALSLPLSTQTFGVVSQQSPPFPP